MGEGLQNRDVAWTSPPLRVDKPRVSGIDLFRGSLVVLVILGHFAELSQRHSFLTWFGIGFRMPLFIGLTGYLFNLELARDLSSAGLLRKYYDRMVLPWLAACAVAVVITGSIADPRSGEKIPRPTFQRLCEKAGATAASTVSSNTDLLICGADVGASKTAKAEKLGVDIVDQSEIWQQLITAGYPRGLLRAELVRSQGGFKATHLSVLDDTPGARKAFWVRADRLISAVTR